jgi:2-dehydro-3-deoxyphosphogluconate aldolase/(4S)-4-hydroxy-2-oxoglutarate aldolase
VSPTAPDRPSLPRQLLEDIVVPVARRVPLPRLVRTVEALGRAGLRVLEVTLDGDDALAAIEQLVSPDRVIGAGTVRDTAEAADAVAAGAAFLVSPHTDVELVRWAAERGIPVLPGAYTPTEVALGWGAGASAIKLFPAAVGGPALLRSLAGPFPEVPFVPSGGVDAGSAAAWLEAGAVAFGVGGWLTDVAEPEQVEQRGRALVQAVAAARESAAQERPTAG